MQDLKNILNHYEPHPLGQERCYAVFLPLIWNGKSGWEVLYQVRSEGISQPGEVAFPGGAVEKGETFEQAAIRETMEELKLPSQKIDLWGEIDYLVSNQQTIHCFVGQLFVENWQSIQPNEEVERLFTIPLEKLKNQPPTYYRLETEVQATGDFPFERIRNGHKYKFSHYDRRIPFYDIGDENLWGMTAQFTHRFTEILEGK